MPATTSPTTSGTCPTGYALKISFVDGRKPMICALITGVPQSPEVPERRAGPPTLFFSPIEFMYEPAGPAP